ncbi:hypothetical protein ACPESV_24440 [Streptomyces umbrinus]|uniref:hypothetical protein n=1 Tax=Streptomyces umbrinus TaxID=67370 RepID=UPI003C2D68A5
MTSFTDDFNRTNSSDLGAGWVEVSGDWSIVSNQLSPGAAGGTVILRAAGAMATDDNSAQVTIAATTAASQGVWCRGNSNLSSGYLWRNDGTSWDLFSVVGGSFTAIGTFAAAAAPGDVVKVQAVGTLIKAFVNGVERVSLVNNHVTTGTSCGIRSESTGSLRYDDFTGADVSAAGEGSATGVFGGLVGAASGIRQVTGAAAFAGGALTGGASGLRTVTGSAAATFGALAGTAHGGVPGVSQGSWYGLLDILRDGVQTWREERDRIPAACLDCGEPLRTGPGGESYCPFDGSIWGAGGRHMGQVAATGRP